MSYFTIKDYIVDRKRIGKGSFSTIYKGYHKFSKKHYAIKEIAIDKHKNKSHIKREFDLMKKINHKHIVKLHDFIIDTNYDNIYFILDYYSNGDLSKFIKNKILKEKYCKKYMFQLSLGLKYLLNNQILHRDLKPQNILLDDNYNIKIADFGFARTFNNLGDFNAPKALGFAHQFLHTFFDASNVFRNERFSNIKIEIETIGDVGANTEFGVREELLNSLSHYVSSRVAKYFKPGWALNRDANYRVSWAQDMGQISSTAIHRHGYDAAILKQIKASRAFVRLVCIAC